MKCTAEGAGRLARVEYEWRNEAGGGNRRLDRELSCRSAIVVLQPPYKGRRNIQRLAEDVQAVSLSRFAARQTLRRAAQLDSGTQLLGEFDFQRDEVNGH